jgi:hypothetical protein
MGAGATYTIVRGTDFPLLQWQEDDWDPIHGPVSRLYYRGASQYEMQQVQNYYQSLAISTKLRLVQDMAELTLFDATNQDTYDIWEMPDATETPSILQHPTLTVATVQFSAADLAVYKNAFNSESQGWTAVMGNFSPAGQTLTGTYPQLEEFYNLNLQGHTNYRKTKYTLRHKTNAPNNYQQNVADLNVACIYSSGTFFSEVTNTGLWQRPLYPFLQYKIANIVAPSTIPAGFAWGWLKSNSTDIFEANTRIGIVTEYELDLWSTLLYPVV